MRFVRYEKLYNMRFDIPSKAIKMYIYVGLCIGFV